MKCKLSDLSNFIMESASFDEASVENYVSTESMIADRGGITEPSALPKSGSIRRYRPGDVLISNIRPYFKKIWRATRTGTCSNDVLVIRSNGSCNPAYLYYVLSSDDFFNYMTATSKGTKMPRGDKEAIMDYEIDLPSLEQQEQFTSTMSKIDDLIWTNSKINDYLAKYAKAIYKASIKTSFSPTKLSSITLAITDGTHSTIQDDPNGDYLLLSSKNIKDGLIQIKDDERRINKEVFERLRSRTNLSKGDILLTSVGTIGECALVSEANNYEFQRSVAIIRPNPECISPEYLYTALVCNQELLINAAHGAVQQCLFLRDINDLEVPLSTKMSDNTTMLLKSIYRNIDHNNQINLNLIKVRDTILNDIFMRYS